MRDLVHVNHIWGTPYMVLVWIWPRPLWNYWNSLFKPKYNHHGQMEWINKGWAWSQASPWDQILEAQRSKYPPKIPKCWKINICPIYSKPDGKHVPFLTVFNHSSHLLKILRNMDTSTRKYGIHKLPKRPFQAHFGVILGKNAIWTSVLWYLWLF